MRRRISQRAARKLQKRIEVLEGERSQLLNNYAMLIGATKVDEISMDEPHTGKLMRLAVNLGHVVVARLESGEHKRIGLYAVKS